MKTTPITLTLLSITAAALLAAGCASSGGKGQAAGNSIQKTAEVVTQVNGALDKVVQALNDLTANPQPDLRPQFKTYKSAVGGLESVATKMRNTATAMEGKTEQLLAEWDKQLALINNEDIRGRSEVRKNDVAQSLTDIKTAFADAKTKFTPVQSDLKDILVYLETDLTPGGVAAIKSTAAKAIAGVPDLRASIDHISQEFKQLGLSLSSVQPVPEPAAGAEPKKK